MNQHILKLRTLLLLNNIYYILFFVALSFSLIFTVLFKMTSRYSINNTEFIGIITNYTIDGNKLTFEFKTEEKFICSYYFETYNELISFKNNINLGDLIKLYGTLELPESNSIPNTFNYKKYLYNNKIFYTLKVDRYNIIKKNANLFYNIKNYVLKKIDKIKYNEYIYTFIIGETYYINQDVNETYRTNGITHLFALSGMHISLFVFLLHIILKKVKISETIKHLIIFLFLILINFTAGFPPSMLRASIFFLLCGINKIFYLNIKVINILLFTFVILVILNPFIIYNLGFQLSFIITFFLILGSSMIKSNNFIINLFLVSFIAFIASIPIVIYNFYYINFMSIINNIFYVPYVSFIAFPCSVLVFIFPFLTHLLHYITLLMETISLFLDKVSIFYISFPKISVITIVIYYILLIIYINYKKKICTILIIIMILISYFIPYLNNNIYIYFLDVGQGDSILITTSNLSKAILIDTGGTINYKQEEWKIRNKNFSLIKQSIIPFLNSVGIKKIDYLFLTHGDYDHMGEAINLVENFKVEKVIFNCGEFNELEKDLIKVLDKKKIPYYSCIKELKINDNKLYFLNNKDYGNENDNSNVIYTEIDGYKFMFMGDAGKTREKDILEKYNISDIDVLKVGHHGSKTSSSKDFINVVNPRYSIISVGKNNRYGHPNKEVLNVLDNSKIYRTDQDGSIMFKINNNKLQVETCVP